jgi:hypothetical protein
MKYIKYPLATLATGIFILPFAANADVLAEYTFTGSSAAEVVVADSSAANVTAEDFTGSGGATFSSYSDMAFIYSDDATATLISAIAGQDYWEFQVEVASGYSLNLESLDFDHYSTNTSDPLVSFESSLSVFSSVNGFDAADVLLTSTETNSVDNSSPQLQESVSVTLSGLDYQGLTGTTTFRIYAFSDGSDEDQIIRLDNVVLNGTVSAVPEPSSFALLAGFCGLASVMVRRRR